MFYLRSNLNKGLYENISKAETSLTANNNYNLISNNNMTNTLNSNLDSSIISNSSLASVESIIKMNSKSMSNEEQSQLEQKGNISV